MLSGRLRAGSRLLIAKLCRNAAMSAIWLAAEIELRHAGRPAVLHDRGDAFAVLIVLHELRAQQARSAVAAARVGAVAELAVDAVERLAALDNDGIGRRPLRRRFRV